MNLSEPPDVDSLTLLRTEQLRAALVAQAARSQPSPRTRPAWVAMTAAGTGVAATVALVVVLVPRGGSEAPPAPPAAGSPTVPRVAGSPTVPAAPAHKPLPRWTAPSSGTVNRDLGPAADAEVRQTLRRCFNGPGQADLRPADADKAIVEWARWMRKPLTFGADGKYHPSPSAKELVVSALRADRRAWATCVDDRRDPPGMQLMTGGGPALGTASGPNDGRPSGPRPSAKNPVISTGGGGGKDGTPLPDGRWGLTYWTSMNVIDRVARAEFRITWPGGAGEWHQAYLHEGTGYVDVTALGRGAEPAAIRVEVRLRDQAGKVFYRTSDSGTPIGYR